MKIGTQEMNGYEKLMASVATQQVEIFLRNGDKSARSYIFDSTEESRQYIFGFEFICKYFGIDIKRARKSIMELSGK